MPIQESDRETNRGFHLGVIAVREVWNPGQFHAGVLGSGME